MKNTILITGKEIYPMKSLKGKNVVITGAGAGIGKKTAEYLAKEKANLALVDINPESLQSVKDLLEETGVDIRTYTCDLSNPEEIEKTARNILDDCKSVDILINNAGILQGLTALESSYESIRKTLDINLMGVIWMTRQFLPHMIRENNGHIVNISSASGLIGSPRLTDYSASKHGVLGYSDSLRMEMKKYRHKIYVTAVCPYYIKTGMTEGVKTPFYSPMLTAEKVAKGIIKGIKKKKPYVVLPSYARIAAISKIVPADITDWLMQVTRFDNAMETHKH